MATGRISQSFADGTTFEVMLDSDLDSLTEVAVATHIMWQQAFADDES